MTQLGSVGFAGDLAAGTVLTWSDSDTAQERFESAMQVLEDDAAGCEVFTVLREDGSSYERFLFQEASLEIVDRQAQAFGNPSKGAWQVFGVSGKITYSGVYVTFEKQRNKKTRAIGESMAAWFESTLDTAQGLQ